MKTLLLSAAIGCIATTSFADRTANQEWVRQRFLPLPSYQTLAIGAEDTSVTVSCHVVTSLLPSAWTNEGPREINLRCNATNRNYTLFFDDTPEVRKSLPISFKFNLSGVPRQLIYGDTNEITRLPALIKVHEPVPGTLILKRML